MTEKSLEDYLKMSGKALQAATAYKVDQITSEKLPEISDHLARQNGTIHDHEKRILEQEIITKVEARENERAFQHKSLSKKQKAGIGGVVVGVATLIVMVIQLGQVLWW